MTSGVRTAAVLAAVVGLAYGDSLQAGFARDSAAIILGAPQVHAATWENVREILTRDYWWPMTVTGTYRALATLSFGRSIPIAAERAGESS